ncbi:hypothetical protein D5S17_34015 [Pseudonocardiaceae bacterium YIM PH 21723]|nr:hypothetical protein D5S17_34015 [Pseudonocardiaceae bacterium YIM PH 21723]
MVSIGDVAKRVRAAEEQLPDLRRWRDELMDRHARPIDDLMSLMDGCEESCKRAQFEQLERARQMIASAAYAIAEVIPMVDAAAGEAQLWREEVLGWAGAPPGVTPPPEYR